MLHGHGFGESREEVEALIADEMKKAEDRPEELGYSRYRQIMDQEMRAQLLLEEENTRSPSGESNFIIVFGNAQNDLFENISDVMLADYDKSSFTLEFPKLLNSLKGRKLAIETI